MNIVIRFLVIRDQGYGNVWARTYKTMMEAEIGMKAWQRERIEDLHQNLINGGDWSIKQIKCEIRSNGAEFEIYPLNVS